MGTPLRIFNLALESSVLDGLISVIWLLVCVVAIAVLAYLFTR